MHIPFATSDGREHETQTRAVYQTIRYFNLFDQPVTATQIWRSLVFDANGHSGTRWGGRRAYRLSDIRAALAELQRDNKVDTLWGYYYIAGKEELVRQRLARHRLAQDKWKLTRRLARWLQVVPFVRMTAMSGSLAAGNTTETSDLDLFVVARAGHIWTARLGLLLVSQLTGRRRTHWDRRAPDKLCLNHYVTDRSLAIPAAVRNVYTAVLYRHAIPLFGQQMAHKWWAANAGWMKEYLMYRDDPKLPSVHALSERSWRSQIGRGLEALLSEPIFSGLEQLAERWQRQTIGRHTLPGRTGRVVLSNRELAFHPDTKVPALLSRFFQDEGQRSLL